MIYEYRVYYAEPDRMNDLHSRFANHTEALFAKHNMKSIGYWVPEGKEEEVLVYILAFESKEQMDKAWDDFEKDPEWAAVQAESEANGPLISKAETTTIYPTSYSRLQ
jgi:hypothetical protein